MRNATAGERGAADSNSIATCRADILTSLTALANKLALIPNKSETLNRILSDLSYAFENFHNANAISVAVLQGIIQDVAVLPEAKNETVQKWLGTFATSVDRLISKIDTEDRLHRASTSSSTGSPILASAAAPENTGSVGDGSGRSASTHSEISALISASEYDPFPDGASDEEKREAEFLACLAGGGSSPAAPAGAVPAAEVAASRQIAAAPTVDRGCDDHPAPAWTAKPEPLTIRRPTGPNLPSQEDAIKHFNAGL